MEQYRTKIEEHGQTMENMGLTPVAARVYIYLMYHNKPGATFEALVNYFEVSKSAISNAIKSLSTTGMIKYKTIDGQRKRYFYISFKSMFQERKMTEKFRVMRNLLTDIQNTKEEQDDFTQELHEASLLYKMLQIEVPIILSRWERAIELDKEERKQ